MTGSRDRDRNRRPCAVELHVRGVIHIEIERMPPAVLALLSSTGTAVLGWVAAHLLH